jgi:hypothetical protein
MRVTPMAGGAFFGIDHHGVVIVIQGQNTGGAECHTNSTPFTPIAKNSDVPTQPLLGLGFHFDFVLLIYGGVTHVTPSSPCTYNQ